MATLLLELFSEEIPSRMQRGGAEQLQRLVAEGFKKAGLEHASPKTFVSPRHLAIQIGGLPTVQPDVKEERRGPKVGAPEQAMKGFLSSTGLSVEQCEQRDGYYYATIERKGRAVAEVAKETIEAALSAFVWPKSMKWGAHEIQWVRPLHKMTCLLDDKIVPVKFGHLTAGNSTHGHRFLAPGEIKITHAEKYESLLADAKVMVDFATRRARIAELITAAAASAKLSLREDEGLLDEVTGLVEHPVPLVCEFDAKFLDLPPEVLISEMKNHQRYFALYGADGKLTNRFITVANMVNGDGGARVKDGNGRVVRARLADGEFYWEQDRKVKLEDWGKKLSDVVFHAKVGMMDAKVARIEKLAVEIAKAVGFKDEKSVRRVAQLCKADLTSGMVGEFPELQGIMGCYYATAQKESAEIADAIRDHYKPLGAGDSVPESQLAAIVAVADKLDSIISLFAAGEKPTGSKDPLALRRAALGIIRITLHHKWNLYLLRSIVDYDARKSVDEFFRDRLNTMLRDEGIRHDVIESIPNIHFEALEIRERAYLISEWLNSESGKASFVAIKRALNLLNAEEKKTKKKITAFIPDGFTATAEGTLGTAIIRGSQDTGEPSYLPKKLENLTSPINRFFDELQITEEGHRNTRLGLLSAVRDMADSVADFSKIEG